MEGWVEVCVCVSGGWALVLSARRHRGGTGLDGAASRGVPANVSTLCRKQLARPEIISSLVPPQLFQTSEKKKNTGRLYPAPASEQLQLPGCVVVVAPLPSSFSLPLLHYPGVLSW